MSSFNILFFDKNTGFSLPYMFLEGEKISVPRIYFFLLGLAVVARLNR